jgi:glycine hydroxymethyltransferase
MCDMAHISGLVAARVVDDPFQWADLVTTTTHKTLRGPRAGLIFFKRQLELRINNAVFPGCQGGPHEHCIAAVAVALRQAASPAFRQYALGVVENCRALAKALVDLGYTLCTQGTDNHLLLWDLRSLGISGARMEKVCELAHITINKNSVAGDVSAVSPGGVRLGTAALTTRGLQPLHFRAIAGFLHQAVAICQRHQHAPTLKDFVAATRDDPDVHGLAERVCSFAEQFDMPGYHYTLHNYQCSQSTQWDK